MEILISAILTLIVIVIALLLLDAKSKYDCRYGWSEKGDNEFDTIKFIKILFEKDSRR